MKNSSTFFLYWWNKPLNRTVMISKASMLELSKQVLKRVSFDKALFRKELSKAIRWINPNEKPLLKVWCLSTFSPVYRDVIQDTFRTVAKV